MSFEFDSLDDDEEEYYLVAVSGTAGSNGYGEFVNGNGDSRHCHYANAKRFKSWDAANVAADNCNSGCEIIEITH